jgi:hypothetical protein
MLWIKLFFAVLSVFLCAGLSYADSYQLSLKTGAGSFGRVSSMRMSASGTQVVDLILGENKSVFVNNGSVVFAPDASVFGTIIAPVALDLGGRFSTVALAEEKYIDSVLGGAPWQRSGSAIINSDGNIIHQLGVSVLNDKGAVVESKEFYFDLNNWYYIP